MISILEYLGVGLVIGAQATRAYPSQIIKSFVLSIIGSSVLLAYSLVTGQYGFSVLNILSVIFAIQGLIKWSKKDDTNNRKH